MNTAKYNLEIATTLIQSLADLGVKTACIAPGSRSTPLTLAAARNPRIETVVHFDERALAFYALGRAKSHKTPVMIITSSGTAVANLLPAVVEAYQTQLPLILLTADRPKELIGTGANQTIKQPHIFSSYAKYIDIEAKLPELPSGPLHINCPFKEPLYEKDLTITLPSAVPVPALSFPRKQKSIPSPKKERLKNHLNAAKNPILVIGDTQENQMNLSHIQMPIFPDILSDLRHLDASPIVPYYDLLLSKSPPETKPDLVLHVGAQPISKALLTWLSSPNPVPVIHITDSNDRVDLNANVVDRIHASLPEIIEILKDYPHPKSTQNWINSSQKIANHIDAWRAKAVHLSEIEIAYTLAKFTPDSHNIMLSNSLPIRLMDLCHPIRKTAPKRFANRGASGIDGILATTLGIAEETSRPTTLLIGDLAFLYDMNTLLMIKNSKVPITIVVINNNGGAIFSVLPIKNDPDFDPFFKTPQNVSPSKIAAAMGIPSQKITQKKELIPAIQVAIDSGKTHVLECETHTVAKDLEDIRQ